MERRVLLAVVLSFLVLYGYQVLFPAPPDSTHKPVQDSKAATAPNASASEHPNPTASVQGAPSAPASSAPGAAPSATLVPGRDVVLDDAYVHAVFTTRGAALKSWKLKKYRDPEGDSLELLAGHAPADAPLPFTIATDDAALSGELASAPFTVTTTPDAAGSWQARFEYHGAAGVAAVKTFTYSTAHPYVVHVSASLTRGSQALPIVLHWGPALGSGIVVKSRTYNPPPQPIFFKDGGSVTRVSTSKIAQQAVQNGTFDFAGVDDHYFLTVAVKPSVPLQVDYQSVDVQVPNVATGAHYVSWSVRYAGPVQNALYYAGPKDFDVLAGVDRNLVRAIDFGMFSWLVVPLLRALDWINIRVGNYGWSIIILTVLINLAIFPLRQKSVLSMRKMQEVQPEVKAIQDRYSNLKMSDPGRAKMNQELMALYKERGVNPASGCVPMILTLPLIYAFYAMLSVAIELRGAPFVLWIHDLSAPDPYFVTPIMMGLTMFVQQKMTPSTADPTQQKMMMFMPIVFCGMFLWAASGLVLYWTISNMWGIGQQMITNRLIGPTTVRTVRPPAERRIKNAGGGKTDQAKGGQR